MGKDRRPAIRCALLALSLALAAAGGQPAGAGDGRSRPPDEAATLTLVPDEPAAPDEALWVRVETALPPGRVMVVAAADGRVLGAIAPFGPAGGEPVATTRISLPRDAGAGPITLKIWVETERGRPRPPTPGELRKIDLITVPVSR